MNNLSNIKDFTDSNHDSSEENEFLHNAIPQVLDKKLSEKYAEKLQGDFGITRPSDNNSSGRTKWLFIALAMLALTIAAFLYFQPSKDSSEIKQQYATIDIQYEELDLSARGEIKDELLISEMTKAYLNKNPKLVIENYKKLGETSNLNNKTLYFIGLSYALEGQYEQAESTLNVILDRDETMYSRHQETRWLLGKILLNNNQPAAANKVLSQINEGDYKYKEAQSLLKK